MMAAEEIALPVMVGPMFGCSRVNLHATDWIYHRFTSLQLIATKKTGC
jgi:hypothetical protein